MSRQLSHTDAPFQPKKFPVILVTDNIIGDANIGSLFRLSDAFGIEKIVFCGSEPNFKSNRLKKTARSTLDSVTYEFQESIMDFLQKKKKEGFELLALEITSNSKPIEEFDCNSVEKFILIAGNERYGIDKAVLELCDRTFHIEMFGKNSSMNVAQSVGIALYEITKAINKLLKK